MYISKTKLVLTGILAALLIMIVTAYSQLLTQGEQPYTPTRLDWLTVKLNAVNMRNDLIRDKYYIVYIPDRYDKNTIQINCYYFSDYEEEIEIYMNKSIQTCQELTMSYAKKYGWDSWIKIKVLKTPAQE